MFGSANFDNRSLELNDELNVAVSSRDLARAVAAGFRPGPERGRSGIDLEQWRQRSTARQSAREFWSWTFC